MSFDLAVDLSAIPTVFDLLHVALAGIILLLLLLCLLLTIITIMALRRKPEPTNHKAIPVSQPAREEVTTQPIAAPRREEPPQPAVIREATPDAALQLLGLFQQEARFIDFIQEDIAAHNDADIGAAVRVVHEGCRKVFKQHLELNPVRSESEGSRVTLPKGFDASSIRISGRIMGDPPFTGTLVHRGWLANRITLPKLVEGHDTKILAPAEVEL